MSRFTTYIVNELLESAAGIQLVADRLAAAIEQAAEALLICYQRGGKVLLCGNGGSAADSQHLATELVARYRRERSGLPAIALTTDTSLLTAISNDYAFRRVFARQVETLGRPGDVLVAISTSGHSENIVEAARSATAAGMVVIALTGGNGGQLASLVDVALVVPSSNTARIQECHITIGHILCGIVEDWVFTTPNGTDE